jgi:hypothetical protein
MEVICEQVQMAFQTIDIIQKEMSDGCCIYIDENKPIGTYEQPLGDGKNVDDAGSHNAFYSIILKHVVAEFYKGLSSTNSFVTMLLMNLCSVHGTTNKLCDELFTLLHHHLLVANSCVCLSITMLPNH